MYEVERRKYIKEEIKNIARQFQIHESDGLFNLYCEGNPLKGSQKEGWQRSVKLGISSGSSLFNNNLIPFFTGFFTGFLIYVFNIFGYCLPQIFRQKTVTQ